MTKLEMVWKNPDCNSASIHLMAIHSANEDWIPYINELKERLLETVRSWPLIAVVKSP